MNTLPQESTNPQKTREMMNHQEEQEEEKEKSVLFLHITESINPFDDGFHPGWLEINLLQKKGDNTVVLGGEEAPTSPTNTPVVELKPVLDSDMCFTRSACAAIGLKLYSFGGQFTNHVFECDTSKDMVSWERSHDNIKMLSRRTDPVAVTVNDKIYIFGKNNSVPWGEEFDPKANDFFSLGKDPGIGSIDGVAVVKNNSEILAMKYIDNDCLKLVSFDVTNRTWEKPLPSNHPFPGNFRPSLRNAVMGDLLFTFVGGNVYVYDINKKEWFESCVQGLSKEVGYVCLPYVSPDNSWLKGFTFLLGNGKLCVVFTTRHEYRKKIGYCHLHCVTCVPSSPKVGADGNLFIEAEVHSSFHYVVRAIELYDAVVISRPPPKDCPSCEIIV